MRQRGKREPWSGRSGGAWTTVGPAPLVVLGYIVGRVPGRGAPLPDAVLEQLGEMPGRLHARSRELRHLSLPGEGFELPFVPELEHGLRELLLPHRPAVERHLRRLHDLADWTVRILRADLDPEQDRHDLAGIEEECVSTWPYLETATDRIEERLRRAGLALFVP
ncbi:MAG: hypothetical protein AB1505_05555 [Candidatus Latescibacterota bacterium]